MVSNETEGHFHARDENAGDNGVLDSFQFAHSLGTLWSTWTAVNTTPTACVLCGQPGPAVTWLTCIACYSLHG